MNFKRHKEESLPDDIDANNDTVDPDLFNKSKGINFMTMDESSKDMEISQMSLKPKPTIKESDFEFIDLIGKGTFGIVYKVREKKEPNKILAIKQVVQNPTTFNRELDVLKLLEHPNCVKLHSHFYSDSKEDTKDKCLNLVMEYYPTNLFKVFKFYSERKLQFPNSLGKIYSYQMLRALSYIHALNICHRDIKPQNIFIQLLKHHLVIGDFGSAKHINQGDKSTTYACTRYYRAPELILGLETYQFEVDIWSVGCVMAEMFIGRALFAGTNSVDQLLQIMRVLGSPTLNDIYTMNPNREIKISHITGSGLNQALPSTIDPLFVDLLSKMLVYNPKQRIKARESLSHPYFDELRETQLKINNRYIVDLFDFNQTELKGNEVSIRKLVPKWYAKVRQRSK